MQHDIYQLSIALLLGIPSIILILCKYYKTSIFFIFASILLGFSALLNISIGHGYAEEGIYATLSLISKELKKGNQDIVVKALDDTNMSSGSNNKYDLWERIRSASEELDVQSSSEVPNN